MLVAIQTLRGNAGTLAAQELVEKAVAAHNATHNATHATVTFMALAPNTKGMQVHLSLWAVLARTYGATLVRLNVHNGMCTLAGTPEAIAATQSAFTATYNAISTLAAATYNASVHGQRMAFTNAFMCGVCGGLATSAPTATLAYGVGYLHTFPAPNATHYATGVTASQPIAESVAPAPAATPAATRTRTRKAA
jgi:hypothetical protein